ncbi:MAG: tyrosinase family protein [Polyangiaceae bacterium]
MAHSFKFVGGLVAMVVGGLTMFGCGDDSSSGGGGNGGGHSHGGSSQGGNGSGGDGQGGNGGDTPAPKVLRKSASELTAEEQDRFVRAFEYAVAQGYFDIFNDEHYDHERNRNHGGDVLATSPITVMTMPIEGGYRLLPWHRSFLLEAEAMLRVALAERDEIEGRDPAEADLLFVPYWDAAHEQDLPAWVKDFEPQGGTAIVPPNLPEGHAGYGKEVGERYDIRFGRWPGQNIVFDSLQTVDYVERILANDDFVDFYDAVDGSPEIVVENYGKAQAGLQVLKLKLPNDDNVQTLIDAFSTPPGSGSSGDEETTNALFEIGWQAAIENQKAMPDPAIIGAVKDVYSLFNFMPHLRMHLWAGGLDPANANLRGTVTYFNELAVEPVFWMLHAEVDRLWYTWETENPGELPPLTGDDAVFNPLTASEGAFYGGGKTYSLEELADHDGLPYAYDQLFE